MFLTGTTILVFLAIALAALLGGYAVRQEQIAVAQLLHTAAVVLFLFMGLQILFNGIAEKTGETTENTLLNGTVTATTTTYEYDQSTDLYTQGLGLLFILIAMGLGYFGYEDHQERKRKEAESIDLK